MRSNNRPTSALLVLLFAVCAALVGWARPALLARFSKIQMTVDPMALPAPEQAVAMSLGYRAALADLLFSNVLVASGIHVQEKRRFELVGEYLDVINALDPTFRSPYRFADTLLVLQATPAREREYRKTREILLRGLKVFPYDGELWINTGQYLAYLASPHLRDPKEREQWRVDGARILARACELIGPSRLSLHSCISAAGVLDEAGERDATLGFLERFLAVSEDSELRELALGYLDRLKAQQRRERAERRAERLHGLWRADLPFVSREQLLLVGPPFAPARCVTDRSSPECATSWLELARRDGLAER